MKMGTRGISSDNSGSSSSWTDPETSARFSDSFCAESDSVSLDTSGSLDLFSVSLVGSLSLASSSSVKINRYKY